MAPGGRVATNMVDHTKARPDIRVMTYTIIPISPARAPISKAGINIPPVPHRFAVGPAPPIIKHQHRRLLFANRLVAVKATHRKVSTAIRFLFKPFSSLLKRDAFPEKH
jgi:hypothetical protein